MKIQQIRYFLVLADELHFWRASEKLYTSQSNLSRHIQSLESEIGISLFKRDKRNVELTPAGAFLKKSWSEILDRFERSKIQAQKIHEGDAGTLSIAYPGSITHNFLPDLLKGIHKNMPELKIELTEPPDELHSTLLLDYKIDLSFSRDKIDHPHIESKELYSEHVCLVVPENHTITEDNFENLQQLEADNFITSNLKHTTYYATLIRQIFMRHGFEAKSLIESDFGNMILSLVAREIGVSIIPYSFKFAGMAGVRFIKLEDRVKLYVNKRISDDNIVLYRIWQVATEMAEIYKKKGI